MATPEGRVKAQVNRAIADLCSSHGKNIYRFMPVQNGMGAPGLDYFLCVNGYFVAIETKARGNTLTPRQTLTKEAIEAAGGRVFKVDDAASLTVAVKEIEKLLNASHNFPRP